MMRSYRIEDDGDEVQPFQAVLSRVPPTRREAVSGSSLG